MSPRRSTALAGPRVRRCVTFCAAASLTLLAALATPTASRAEDPLREAAMVLFTSFWNTTGFLMACPSYVGENPPYLDAAEAWKQRHNAYMQRVTEVIDGTGGMTQEAKSQIAQKGFDDALLKLQLRGDSGLYCFNNLAGDLNDGSFDFESQDETAPALARLMGTSGS